MAPSSAPAPAKFSLALGSKKAPAPANKKRPHSTLQDSDDEDAAPQAQTVSHFDVAAGGAIDSAKKETSNGPLVISSQPNRDWRAESQRKRQKSALPNRQNAHANAAADDFEEEKPVYGLNIVNKEASSTPTEEQNGAATTPAPEGEAGAAAGDSTSEPAKPKTDDQLAIEALTGDKPKSELVLPAVETEEQAFRRDYESAPDMASLNEYEAVPVEEFGAALLRGMGWKEGEAIGRRKGQKAVQPRILEKRPALLGIGAKADAAIGEEMGTWGKTAKSRRKGPETYNPVVLRNAKTGEQLTEEELRKKMEDLKNAENEAALSKKHEDSDRHSSKTSRRHRDYDDYDSERREKDRRRDDRDRGRDRDNGSRYKSSRRHRSRSESDESSHGRRKYESRSDYDRRSGDRKRSPRRRDREEAYSSRHSRHGRDRSRERYESDRRRR
ncbi:DExH-box splicing factor binding site-domain-containing protein [Phyllosticta capitalensis]|uniref:DExH-box splicing factor binding site-domain-containing protein n=1 Tax=Phyllosticta capitalensis TaxID=121624 RepID=UPI0031328D8A